MEGFERRWLLDASWCLQVEEKEDGWSIREAEPGCATGIRPLRWSDATGAFGVASHEFRLDGRSGVWELRVYPSERVVASSPVPGGRLDLPRGWWVDPGGQEAARSLGFGATGSSVCTLERCERRGWISTLLATERTSGPGSLFTIVRGWHGWDASHGDTEILHRMAPLEGEAALRETLRAGIGSKTIPALDCRGIVEESDTEEGLADGFLFAHQAFGARWLCWSAPPPPIVVRALERAHMDSQGDLFGVWLASGDPVATRSAWRRLGPLLRPSESVPDCYVWER